MPSTASSSPTPNEQHTPTRPTWLARVREGTAGRLKNPARSTCPRTSTLRISHFPDPRTRRYKPPSQSGRARGGSLLRPRLTTKGSRNDTTRADELSSERADRSRLRD